MSKFAHVCNHFLTTLLVALCLTSVLFAQSDVGTITGYVKDPTGSVVPGAKVVIKSEATSEEHAVTADSQGHYTVPGLVPGNYTMTASAPGFKQFVSSQNKLQANSTIGLDASLTVGQTSETVTVTSTAEVLQTESGSVQAEVTGQQIQDQELNGRSPI